MLRLFRSKFFWLVLLIVVGSLITMSQTSLPRDNTTVLEKVIHNLYTPLQSGAAGARSSWGSLGTIFSDKKVLSQRIDELVERNKQMSIDNQILREYEAEAKRLRRIVDFQEDNLETFDLVPASIIARSPNNWYQTLTINKGLADGLEKGMPVMHPDGLVGRISSVTQNSAQVSLITDREMAVGVVLQRTRETNGIVEGEGDSNLLRMNNIPYYSSIEVNDRVITSGLSTIYPKGIDVGIISKISREPSGLLLIAEVKPVVDFDRLEEVLVISSYHPPVVTEPESGE